MCSIKLARIDESNFIDAFSLRLAEGQEGFVSSPVRSLAQAYVYYQQCTPFGIYCGDTMVGYVMVIYDYDLAAYNIWHLMIDKDFQRRGYGTAAMRSCLDYIGTKPFGPSNRVSLTCHAGNAPALRLYKNLGFWETGEMDGDEIELALFLKESP